MAGAHFGRQAVRHGCHSPFALAATCCAKNGIIQPIHYLPFMTKKLSSRHGVLFLLAVVLAALPFLPQRFAKAQALSFAGLPYVNPDGITETSATVLWYTTLEASSVVEYGATSALGLQQANKVFGDTLGQMNDEMTLTHRVVLQELKPGTHYYFRVRSTDASGIALISDIKDFETKAPACTADVWACGDWGRCSADGIQVRDCKLTTDCPAAQTPSPVTEQKCTPPVEPKPEAAQPPSPPVIATPISAPSESNQSETKQPDREPQKPPPTAAAPELQANSESAASQSARETPSEPEGGSRQALQELKDAMASSSGASSALDPACVARKLSPERCQDWLEAQFSDRSCADAGRLTKESCVAWLEQRSGGQFPGCTGKSDAECRDLQEKSTMGYMSGEEKRKADEAMLRATVADFAAAVQGMMAVGEQEAKDAAWYPAATGDKLDISPGLVVMDSDHDGLSDDLERRLGTDPTKPDFAGATGAKASREALRQFFEKGDKPQQGQFAAIIDSLIHVNDDRSILGLKKYDPSISYLPGDAAAYARPLYDVDLNLDGRPDLKASYAILTAVFGKATAGSSFVGALAPLDRALVSGQPLEQPRGYGSTDKSLTIQVSGRKTPGAAEPSGTGARPQSRISGRAVPGSTVSIFIYSYIPLVLTTTADANGNYTYDLSGGLTDGNHTAYVTIADQQGRVVSKSEPLAFVVQGAEAMTVSEFMNTVPAVAAEPVKQMQYAYLLGTLAVVLLAGGAVWFLLVRRRPTA